MKALITWVLMLSMLSACSGQDLIDQGKKQLEEKNFEAAAATFKKATELDPKSAAAWHGLALAHLQVGTAEQALSELENAVSLAQKANAPKGELAQYQFDRGQIHYAMGRYDLARDDFQAAVNADYKRGESYAYLGTSTGYLGDDITALQFLNEAVKADPKSHFAWSNRGFYNSKLGDNRTAIADFTKAIELQPDDKVSFLNRGYTYIGMNDMAAALKDIDKALELDPEYLGAIAYKGIILTNSGRPADALPWLDRAVNLQPDNPAFYYYRGVAKISTNDKAGGCEDLVRAEAGGHMDGVSLRQENCK